MKLLNNFVVWILVGVPVRDYSEIIVSSVQFCVCPMDWAWNSDSGIWRTAASSRFSLKFRVHCRQLRPKHGFRGSRTFAAPEDEHFLPVISWVQFILWLTVVANTSLLVCCEFSPQRKQGSSCRALYSQRWLFPKTLLLSLSSGYVVTLHAT